MGCLRLSVFFFFSTEVPSGKWIRFSWERLLLSTLLSLFSLSLTSEVFANKWAAARQASLSLTIFTYPLPKTIAKTDFVRVQRMLFLQKSGINFVVQSILQRFLLRQAKVSLCLLRFFSSPLTYFSYSVYPESTQPINYLNKNSYLNLSSRKMIIK